MNNTQKTWLRNALIALLLVAMAAPAFAFRMIQNETEGRVTAGAQVQCDDPDGFAHWNTREIWWSRNVQNYGANAISALYWARVEWGSESDFILRDGGNTNAGFATDNINTTIWEDGGACTGNCLGLTALVLGPNQEILESDITFNDDARWRTDGRDRSRDRDVQAVATHEFGHSLGIHHSEVVANPPPTMRPTYEETRVGGRTLEADDRAAIACIDEQFPFEEPGCTGPPAMPNGISGPNYSHCSWSTENYTTNTVPDTDTYRWEVVGTSWAQTSTSPSTWLTASFGTGVFTFRVRAENECGASGWRSTVLVVHQPGTGPCF